MGGQTDVNAGGDAAGPALGGQGRLEGEGRRQGLSELVLDRPDVTVVGDGEPGTIIVEADGGPVLSSTAPTGRVVNLTLRQPGGGQFFAVDVHHGGIGVERCDITSQSLSAVVIRRDADPVLRGSRVHHATEAGVFLYDQARGALEGNDVFGNALAGLEIASRWPPPMGRSTSGSCGQSSMRVAVWAMSAAHVRGVVAEAWETIQSPG